MTGRVFGRSVRHDLYGCWPVADSIATQPRDRGNPGSNGGAGPGYGPGGGSGRVMPDLPGVAQREHAEPVMGVLDEQAGGVLAVTSNRQASVADPETMAQRVAGVWHMQ